MARTPEVEAMEMEVDDDECPIKQVDITVPKTDNPTMPVLTFRMWVLGLASCVLLSFANQFFGYGTQPMRISQIAVVPIGRLMAKTLPTRLFFQGTRWEFTLNPGPFNIKEHVLITIFANCGVGTVYASYIISAVKLFYKRKLTFIPALFVMLTTQVLGFGWAGLFRRYLVEPGEMWWPSNLVQVSLFRALHEKERRPRGKLTRTQFFLLVMICSCAYYTFPGYLFTMLKSFSWICWLAPKSVLVQQIGSGMSGLGVGVIGFNWATISGYLGSPIASPWFATANVAIGFCLIMYVMTPLCYWLNVYNAKRFSIYSSDLYTASGSKYNIIKIVDSKLLLDRATYAKLGPVHLSTLFAMTYGIGFATLSATLVHVLLFHGSEIWKKNKRVFGSKGKVDIHTRLMQKYNIVPTWWFLVILLTSILAAIFACEYYKETLQLRWWGILIACFIALAFTLPIGIINATTNQQPGLNIITEYIIGYVYPERPVANMCFKVYGYISMVQALNFVADFKLGHYMKIPPRSMFMAQVVGTVVAVMVYLLTEWWMMEFIPNLCDRNMLPADSPWKCPMDTVFFNASVIWGLVGPRRTFGNLGEYGNVNWFFVGGAIAPLLVWLAHKAFPRKKWICLIHMPVLLGATSMMPPASAVNYTSWIIVGFLSGYVLFRYRTDWWKRYNYVLSAGLDAGTAFMTLLLFFSLGHRNISLNWWGSNSSNLEGCPLASCPTAKGIVVDGCPVF